LIEYENERVGQRAIVPCHDMVVSVFFFNYMTIRWVGIRRFVHRLQKSANTEVTCHAIEHILQGGSKNVSLQCVLSPNIDRCWKFCWHILWKICNNVDY